MAFYESKMFIAILRALQVVFAILVLGLTAYVGDWWRNYWHASSPSQVSFLLFCSVWAMLSLIYLIIVPWRFANSALASRFAVLGVEVLAMLFWFAGFIAVAVFLSDRVCFGHVCSAAKAADAFGAFEWLLFSISTTLSTMHVLRNRGDAPVYRADPKLNMAEGV